MILDTNALSAFLLADQALLKVFPAHTVLRLPVIVLGEYRFGLIRSRDKVKLSQLLDELETVVEVLSLDSLTVKPYAQIREQLRKATKAIPQNDAWIAALAIQHELPILSRDQHFDNIEGVRRIGW